jgi:hypothetical protein
MQAYFIQIAAVRLSARLLGKKLIDNYGFHGALPKFSSVRLSGITEGDGIENVPGKADCFNLGNKCSESIRKYLGELSKEERLYLDAVIAKNLFLNLSPEKRASYTDAELEEVLRVIFSALLKKAHIRTHTAKPGDEDINAWLAGYYQLQKDYDSFISSLINEIIDPNPDMMKKFAAFFDKTDSLIALALKDAPPAANEVKAAVSMEPVSSFGRILQEVVRGAA